jgi:hypothetical protein
MPFPYTQAVLTYTALAATGVAPATLATKMAAVDLTTNAMNSLLGATLSSDVTEVTDAGAERTLTFALGEAFNSCLQPSPPAGPNTSLTVPPEGGPSIPNPPLASASCFFQNLYTHTLRAKLVCSPDQLFQEPPILT